MIVHLWAKVENIFVKESSTVGAFLTMNESDEVESKNQSASDEVESKEFYISDFRYVKTTREIPAITICQDDNEPTVDRWLVFETILNMIDMTCRQYSGIKYNRFEVISFLMLHFFRG